MITHPPTWPATYRRGSHCFSTMLTNLVADTPLDLGEEMCFGIGGGLGFMYYREGESCYINGRMHNLEHSFARRLGGTISYVCHATFGQFLTTARAWAEQGRRPFAYCEAQELDAFAGVVPWHRVNAFGEHALPLIEIGTEHAVVHDYLWGPAHTVDLAELERATALPHAADVSMAAPARRFAVGRFDFPARLPDIAGACVAAIADNVSMYLHPTSNNQGVRALKLFERDLGSLPDLLPVGGLRAQLASIGIMTEQVGTGGGNYRRLYSRFLRQAAELLAAPVLASAATAYARLGNRWKALARDLLSRSEAAEPTTDWRDLLTAVRELRTAETRAAENLNAFAGSAA